jgi:hypothetical protein
MSSFFKLMFWACVFYLILKVLLTVAIAVAVVAAVFVTLKLCSMA